MMTDEKSRTPAVEILTRYIERHSLRKTPERFAILDKVLETSGHFTIDSLHSQICEGGYYVSKVTVYNAVSLFIDAGLIRRHDFGNQNVCYEKIAGTPNHYHLVCRNCGKVREVKEPKDSDIFSSLVSRRYGAFVPDHAEVSVMGLCGVCARKQRKNSLSRP